MKFSRKSMMIGLLAAGLTATSGLALRGQAAGGGAGAAPAATYPAPTKLAVVNLVDLFDGLSEKIAADTAIDTMKKNYDDEVRKRAAKIDDAQKALGSTFKSGTPEFLKQQDDLLIMATDLDSYRNYVQAKLQMELRVRTAGMYHKIKIAVEDYAKVNGIALVFVGDNPDLSNARSQDQLQAMVTVSKLLYWHPSFDITNAIKEKMNREFTLGH